MARFGVRPPKLLQYPGLKEEYYLYDFEPDRTSSTSCSSIGARTLVVVRTPPDVSLYHRRSNPFFPRRSAYLGRESDVHAVVLPRSRGAARLRAQPEPAVADRPRPRRGRAEPDRARRPRRLGRRDDEPRGGGARRPRLHDVRRADRRRRRDADPRRAVAAAHRPARARAREARAGRVGARPARPADPARPAAVRGARKRWQPAALEHASTSSP